VLFTLMPETTKIGVEISATTWEQFRNDVKNRRGRVRGVLGNEVEKALEKQMMATEGGDAIDHMKRIESKLDTVIDTEADGAGVALSEPESAPTRETKPKPNQSRREKVQYLLDELAINEDGGSIHENAIRNVIQEEYNFSDDNEDDYLSMIIDRLDAIPDPKIDGMFVWGETEDERYNEVEEMVCNE